jgi:TetR/AcrR family transcriptional regulator, cholesterol catabolism regulator
MAVDLPPARLTRSQAARRQRVITAALELAASGGYEAVQMRDVATTAGVALGTIYRYFSSKDHLLAAALVDWVGELEARVSQRPPVGDTTADRVVSILQRATRAMEREPKLTEAVVTALSSSDANAAECQREVSDGMNRIMARAFGDELPPEQRDDITRVMGHVWFSSLVGWVNGWSGISKVGDEVQLAARLLLSPYDAA